MSGSLVQKIWTGLAALFKSEAEPIMKEVSVLVKAGFLEIFYPVESLMAVREVYDDASIHDQHDQEFEDICSAWLEMSRIILNTPLRDNASNVDKVDRLNAETCIRKVAESFIKVDPNDILFNKERFQALLDARPALMGMAALYNAQWIDYSNVESLFKTGSKKFEFKQLPNYSLTILHFSREIGYLAQSLGMVVKEPILLLAPPRAGLM